MPRPTLSSSILLLLFGCSEAFTPVGPDAALPDSGVVSLDTGDSAATTDEDITVRGFATGATGLPIGGVTVAGGQGSVTTDATGAFTVSGPAPLDLTFTASGRRAATRRYTHAVDHARVGLLPARVGTPMSSTAGGTVAVGDAALFLPADALGGGLAAVTFDPLDLVSAGLDALPPGVHDADGNVATTLAAAWVEFTGPAGAITLASPATVTLPVYGDAVGASTSVLKAEGGAWQVVGSADVVTLGTGFGASFTVDAGGLYALGQLDTTGCLGGTVVDNSTGAPAAGARVRTYVRPDANAPAAFLDEVTAGADGSFCVTGSGGGASVYVDYTDSLGGAWATAVNVTATGTDDTCGACTDVGNVALAPAGCATGNLYGADGSALVPSPFAWEEGDIVTSEMNGGAAIVTFYARAGNTFHLRGPAGYDKAFSVTEGTSVEASNCTRLGNLQAPASCVAVDVTDAGAGLAGVNVAADDGAWATTDADGAACVVTDDGTTTFTADWLVGAQAVSQEAVATLAASAGGCEAGACVEGPSFEAPEAGCVSGTVRAEGGVPGAGLTIWSSSFDSTTTAADGSYTVATAGVGTAWVWADGWAPSPVTDQAASLGCTTLDLYADAGAVPDLVIAQGAEVWLVDGEGSETPLVSGAVVSIVDIQSDRTADLLLGLLNVYTWSGSAIGAGWGNFGASTAYWSAIRISPDHSLVGLQGYGSTKPEVWVYDIAGNAVIQLSTTAGTDVDGLAFSSDSNWIASTRRDGAVEVTPVSGARSPVTIAPTTCAHPVWWDIDTIALQCAGDVYLYEMDGSSSVQWLGTSGDERVWAITADRRVVYTVDETLRMADADGANDVALYTGSPGTTFARVRAAEDGLWVAAIVKDPTLGTDVLAVADQAPYTPMWRTATPSETESSIDWAD
jgi:hypothetical protein